MRCIIIETLNTFASLNRTLYNAGAHGWLVLATAQREKTGQDGDTSGSPEIRHNSKRGKGMQEWKR